MQKNYDAKDGGTVAFVVIPLKNVSEHPRWDAQPSVIRQQCT